MPPILFMFFQTLADGEFSVPVTLMSFVGGAIFSGLGVMCAIFARGQGVGRWQGEVDNEIKNLGKRISRLEHSEDDCQEPEE